MNIQTIRIFVLTVVIAFTGLASCTYDVADECSIIEVSYSTDIAPILDYYCSSCHGEVDAEADMNLTLYEIASYQVIEGDLIERIEMMQGEPDVMPPSESLSLCEIAEIKVWATQGALDN